VSDVSAWERAYQRFETPEQEQRKFVRRLRSLGVQQWSRTSSVLEICSGRGNGLIAWQRLGFSNVQGVDLSFALVERSSCRRSCIVGDARRLPIRTASRDVAVVQGGLHHLHSLDDLRAALTEIHRVLKADGRLIVIEPWSTPFLRFVHFVTERRMVRAVSGKLDAFAAMTDEERPTYEAWLARPQAILAELTARFEAIVIRQRSGKLVFLGRPLSRLP
jgi:ubiquinone/menaquinone biosynthesis C-methylase UbiE